MGGGDSVKRTCASNQHAENVPLGCAEHLSAELRAPEEDHMPPSVGDALPDVNGTVIRDGRPGPVSLAELVGDKKTVIFGVPGMIRTCGPQIRNLVLYPTELRALLI